MFPITVKAVWFGVDDAASVRPATIESSSVSGKTREDRGDA
jgi:hypothetical protein